MQNSDFQIKLTIMKYIDNNPLHLLSVLQNPKYFLVILYIYILIQVKSKVKLT